MSGKSMLRLIVAPLYFVIGAMVLEGAFVQALLTAILAAAIYKVYEGIWTQYLFAEDKA